MFIAAYYKPVSYNKASKNCAQYGKILPLTAKSLIYEQRKLLKNKNGTWVRLEKEIKQQWYSDSAAGKLTCYMYNKKWTRVLIIVQ